MVAEVLLWICVSYAIIKNRFFHGNGFNWVQIAEFNQLCVNWVDCLIDGIAISHSIGEIKWKKKNHLIAIRIVHITI